MIRISPGVASVAGRDGVVILAMAADRCVPLEVSGGGEVIWHILRDSPSTLDDLVDTIAGDAEVERDEVLPAVSSFVDVLLEYGLVTRGDDSASGASGTNSDSRASSGAE